MRTRPTTTALGLLFSLGLAAGAGGTAATQEAVDSRRAFNLIDANNDGVIDAEEMRSGSESWFLAYDADGDGVLTRDELASQGGATGRLVLADLDQDGDGMISREEFLGAQRGYYDQRVAEGEITSRDYAEMVSERDDRLVPDLDQDDVVSEEEAAADWQRSFAAMDLDDDDQISQDEWLGDVEGGPAFADLDADQDQAVSRQEYLAYGKQSYYGTREQAGAEPVSADAYLESTRWRDEALRPNPDLDGDGVISAEEFAADAERWFGSFDRDRDGIITEPDYDPTQAEIRDITDTFAASGDADVIVSRDDFVAFREQQYEEADLDGDGVVSVWEYRAYRGN